MNLPKFNYAASKGYLLSRTRETAIPPQIAIVSHVAFFVTIFEASKQIFFSFFQKTAAKLS